MIGRGSLAVAAILAAAPLRAAPPSAQAFGSATATVIRPLTVAPLAVMDFGTITNAPGAGGTATVSPGTAGARFTGATSAVCSGADCGQAHAAAFRVSGEPMRDYTISLPASVVATGAATGSGTGAPPLTIEKLQIGTSSGGASARLDGSGNDSFEVGGTIVVPANTPAAHYRATFSVMVSYI